KTQAGKLGLLQFFRRLYSPQGAPTFTSTASPRCVYPYKHRHQVFMNGHCHRRQTNGQRPAGLRIKHQKGGEQGLKLLVRRSQQQEIRKLRGRIKWEGDLDEMRGGN